MQNTHIRYKIVELSLLLEMVTSIFLRMLLNISDDKTSISFGRKSEALSFNNKVNLLMDLDIIDKDDYNSLKQFMFIRNQFIHNMDVKDFEGAFDENPKLKNQFNKHLGIEVGNNSDTEVYKAIKKSLNPIIEKIQKIIKVKNLMNY
ncbi:MAG: hypothetical protein NTU43_00945 [Bacteroidetes bacterium]|nr:hypothetical protein [Bacteroidota bacterium]